MAGGQTEYGKDARVMGGHADSGRMHWKDAGHGVMCGNAGYRKDALELREDSLDKEGFTGRTRDMGNGRKCWLREGCTGVVGEKTGDGTYN